MAPLLGIVAVLALLPASLVANGADAPSNSPDVRTFSVQLRHIA
jgi:hypothetical protein